MKSRSWWMWTVYLAVAVICLGVVLVGSFEGVAILCGVLLLASGIGWRRAEKRRRGLEEELAESRVRARRISDQAWQNALLAQIADELRISMDEGLILKTTATALGRALQASRVVFYRRAPSGRFRLAAQFASQGVAPLAPSDILPGALVSDRALWSELASGDAYEHEDPELRAFARRLQVRSLLLSPLRNGLQDGMLTIHQCDRPRGWTSSEERFVQRFAERVTGLLEQSELYRRQVQSAQAWSALLRVTHALSSAREPGEVLELAVSAGAPIAGARRSAIFVEGDGSAWTVAAQKGFRGGLSSSCVDALAPRLEDASRRRAPTRLDDMGANVQCGGRGKLASTILVPLFYGRERMGVFLFEGRELGRDPKGEGGELAQAVADLTASAFKKARLFETLTSSEARYADLYDNAPDLYQTLDGRGTIRDCNRTECRTLGYAKSELVGRKFGRLLAGESVPVWRRLQRELFEKGELRDASLTLRTKDGAPVEVLLNASAIPEPDGACLSARVVMRDVTELRRLEHQLRQSQKLESVGALAGGVAHDFNNVLGGILGYASLLRAHLKDRPLATKYVETIERSAVRGAELTGRLLSASRKSPARRAPVNLNHVIVETLELLAHTFHKKIGIEKRLDPTLRAVMADPSQIQQVVLNLCVNARDAMPEGGLLRVSTGLKGPDKLHLSVEDTGVGMEPGTIERLFEPFFSTKGEAGTGLGLSVVYSIVTSLGGDVRVQSSPGRGACFDVFLPCQWAEETTRRPESRALMQGQGELILLVDDEKVLRELGKEILETQGYRVQAVSSGEEALAFVRKSRDPVSLVILDLVMPGIDGAETYRRLRRFDSSLPVLLSSGLTAEEGLADILAEGARGFIPKPFGMDELTQAVSLALGGSAPRIVH